MVLRGDSIGRVAVIGCAVAGLGVGTPPAHADEPLASRSASIEQAAYRETWTHVSSVRYLWSITNGTTWTPNATHVREGVRIRLVGGLDGYKYKSRQYDSWTPNGRTIEHQGLRQRAEAMAGYQWRIGAWTLKAFTGVHARRALIEAEDRELGVRVTARELAISAKVVGEAWWHISDQLWASGDISYTALERAYASRLRLGWRPAAAWSLGPEVSVAGTFAGYWPSHSQRLGAFLRYDNGVHEVSVAGGFDLADHQATAPYASVQYLVRY